MSQISTGANPVGRYNSPPGRDDAAGRESAVSWAAIFAGAAGAAALSLLLLILGTGLGLTAVSPWTMEGIGAATFGFATIAWLTFTQIAASGMGGYLAGRLRTKWASVHADEVFFRDTAHGFLSWAVASLLMAAVLASVAGSIVSGGFRAGAEVAGGAASALGTAGGAAASTAGDTDTDEIRDAIGYMVDRLFRSESGPWAGRSVQQAPRTEREADLQREADASSQQRVDQREGPQARASARDASEIPIGEVTRIFARALWTGELPEDDERYVGRLIAQWTDLSQDEATRRVSDSFDDIQNTFDEMETTAREVAEQAREGTAYGALWVFVALLIGAFMASLMAVFGGRQRDT